MMQQLTEYKGQPIPEGTKIFRQDDGKILMMVEFDEETYDRLQRMADRFRMTKQTFIEGAVKSGIRRLKNG